MTEKNEMKIEKETEKDMNDVTIDYEKGYNNLYQENQKLQEELRQLTARYNRLNTLFINQLNMYLNGDKQ